MKHTPEPWRVAGERGRPDILGTDPDAWNLTGFNGTQKINGSGRQHGRHQLVSKETVDANARRIVACVNACAGIDTVTLESLASTENPTLKNCATALLQRDQLLAAAKALAAVDFGSRGWCAEAESAAVRLRNAIAAVEGGNQS